MRQNASEKHRQRWMTNFETAVLELDSSHRGKIDWNTAAFFYNSHKTSDEAAAQYVATRKGGEHERA